MVDLVWKLGKVQRMPQCLLREAAGSPQWPPWASQAAQLWHQEEGGAQGRDPGASATSLDVFRDC